jgi:predicted PhzF superfamily epimerase YddE/YHI9
LCGNGQLVITENFVENNQNAQFGETSFFVDKGEKSIAMVYAEIEMDLCGHATPPVTAHCLKDNFRITKKDEIVFETLWHLIVAETIQNGLIKNAYR